MILQGWPPTEIAIVSIPKLRFFRSFRARERVEPV